VSLRDAESLNWEVNGLGLAGLSWGCQGERPVLALHGWLDNAASFSALGPLLTGCQLVALDLSGHGRSDHRSPDASYQIWDDLPEILGVLNELGWEQFDLVGHSRGAIIAGLLAATFPERVKRLVLLDAVSPEPVPEQDFARQMRRALTEKQESPQRKPKIFATLEEAAARREAGGLSHAAALALAARNVSQCKGGGVTWTTDSRLQCASAVKLTGAQIRAVLGALTMPVMLLLAKDVAADSRVRMAGHARQTIRDIRVAEVVGGHHFHLEQGAGDVAQLMLQFLTDRTGRENI